MSTTIDQRVVEMRFDNRHFEKNVSTTMSTLDKFKQKLNLTGASKGLENVSAATKKVDMRGLGAGVEAVTAKFSALQVMGVTALANITNSAVNTGKRMISALTIDPIKTGFQEYETQMNAVQTILANTKSKGSTLDDVNNALEQLNTYADKTIYNFTEMTRNIGTFTAAGVDLNTSVESIKGIANLAAVSGSSSQQASTAMYQLSQALAAGRVSLMDWNSVVNAGMGGELFQNALIRTSELMKTGAKDAIATYGSFRESLTRGEWLTTEVLTETLKQLSGAYSEADLIAQGFTKEQAKEIAELADTAVAAATEVKTFTQLWDVMKESAQSGWSQTWKLLVGDFEEAKALLTPLANFFTGDNGVITKMSEARNKLIEGALGKTFTGLMDKIKNVVEPVKKSADSVKEVVDSVKDYGKVVDEIIGGKWGNGQERWDALAKSGYDWAHAQNLVNEKLGDTTRHATKYKEAQKGVEESQKKTTDSTTKYIAELARKDEAELRSLNYDDKQIAAFKELAEVADKTGIPLEEFIENIDEIDGRYLLINSFKNAASGLIGIFKVIGQAWRDIFEAMKPDQLFDIIAGIHKFSLNLRLTDSETGELTETGDKLMRTFRGVFSILGMVSDILGGGLKIAFKAVSAILGYFDLNILDVTAAIGDAIYKFREATNISKLFSKALEIVVPLLSKAGENLSDWFTNLKGSDAIKQLGSYLRSTAKAIKEWVSNFKGLDSISSDVIAGLVQGLRNGADKVWEAALEIAKNLWESFCEFMGIHSPSTKMIEAGGYIIEGLVQGIQNGISALIGVVKNVASTITEFLGNIDWSTVFAGGVSVGMLYVIRKLVGAFETLASPLEGLGDLFESASDVLSKSAKGINKVLKSFANVMNSFAFSIKAKALKNIAISLAILVGSIIALTLVDTDKLWKAVGVVGTLAAILAGLVLVTEGLSILSSKFGSGSIEFGKISLLLLGISGSLLLMAIAIKQIANLNPEQAKQGFLGLAGVVIAMGSILAAYGILVKGKSAKNIDKAGIMILKMTVALLLMVQVVKAINKLSAGELIKGGVAILAFVGITALLSKITQVSGKGMDKLGGMMIKLSFALMLMVGVVKLINMLSAGELIKGGIAITAFVGIIYLLNKATQVTSGTGMAKLGGTMLGISVAMLLMVGVIKLISGLSPGELIKGGIAIAAFTGIIVLLINTIKRVGPDVPKLAGTLIAISIAMGIMAAVSVMMSLMSLSGLAKGLIAVGMLGAIMALMIVATRGASDCKGSIIAMAIAIGVMAVAVAALTMIDVKKLAGATVILSVLMGMFALMTKAASGLQKTMGSLIVMTVAIGMMAGIIYMLTKLPVESVMSTATALSILMLSLSGALLLASKVGGNAKNAVMGMVYLSAMVVPLSVFAFALSKMPDLSGTTKTVMLLSGLMTAMTVLLVPLSLIGKLAGASALLGIVSLTAMVVPLAAFAYALGQIPDLSQSKTTVMMLTQVMTAMTLLLIPLTLIGYLAVGALLGVVSLTAMVIPLTVFAYAITKLPDLSGATTTVNLLTSFMDVMTDILMKVTPLAPLAVIGVAAIAALSGVITAFAVLATGVGALMEHFPSLETFLNKGIVVLEGVAEGLGRVIGSFITGFTNEVMTILPNLGLSLSLFMTNAMPFITGIKMVDESVLENVKILAGSILALTAADFISGIASFDGTTFASLGTQLSQFITNAAPFLNAVSTLDPAIMEGVNNLAQALLTLTKAELISGLVSAFGGEVSFEDFGTQLISFGNAITTFSNTLVQNGGINEEAITAAANAGKIMAELQSVIEPIGGVVQAFTGQKNLAEFGTQLVAYGAGIAAFSRTVSEEGAIDEKAIKAAADAGKIMAGLQEAIEPTNGVLQWLTGTTGLDTFGAQLAAYGKAVSEFSKSISGENAIDEGAITAAANAGKIMSEVQKGIPEDKWLDGKISIDDFGKKIKSFGKSIKAYSDEVSEVNVEAVSNSTSAAKTLVSIAKSASGLDTDNIGNFSKIKTIGEALKSYSDKIADIESGTVSKSISYVKRLISLVNSMAGLDISGVSSFKTAMSDLGKVNLEDFTKAFKGSTEKLSNLGADMIISIVKGLRAKHGDLVNQAKTLVGNAAKAMKSQTNLFAQTGSGLINAFVKGIISGRSKTSAAMKSNISSAIGSVRSYYTSFYNAGSYLVSGFAAGISANTWRAEAKARAMANAAEKAAKEALDINSPSKVFRALGYSVPEGFAMGIDKLSGMAEASAKSMSTTAIGGVKDSISRIADMVSGDMDVQPTIRPVLDLSDIRSGVSSISSIFNGRNSLGVMANVNAINSMMNSRNQNGVNDDIISAINKLRKELGNISGPSYAINGVNIGSENGVAEAFETIIRAARIERRS